MLKRIHCTRSKHILCNSRSGADFAGRGTSSKTVDLVSRGFRDIVFADYGDHWKVHRKLARTALTSYGERRGNIEDKIKIEADALSERLRKTNGKPVDVDVEFGRYTSKTIFNVY